MAVSDRGAVDNSITKSGKLSWRELRLKTSSEISSPLELLTTWFHAVEHFREVIPMQKIRLLIVSVALATLCPLMVHGQELQGTINGTVTDPSGAVISGATVKITQNDVTGASRTVVTDARGSYTATNLPAGNSALQPMAFRPTRLRTSS